MKFIQNLSISFTRPFTKYTQEPAVCPALCDPNLSLQLLVCGQSVTQALLGGRDLGGGTAHPSTAHWAQGAPPLRPDSQAGT